MVILHLKVLNSLELIANLCLAKRPLLIIGLHRYPLTVVHFTFKHHVFVSCEQNFDLLMRINIFLTLFSSFRLCHEYSIDAVFEQHTQSIQQFLIISTLSLPTPNSTIHHPLHLHLLSPIKLRQLPSHHNQPLLVPL